MKQAELKIAKFFDWNLMFMSFYDHLEQFMALGMGLRSDFLKFERPVPMEKSAINRPTQSETSPDGNHSTNLQPPRNR